MAEIAPDPPGWLTALRFDIDTEGGGAAWIEAELPAPNLVVVNPRNGHAHLIYLLGGWIRTDFGDPSRLKVVRYAAAIERAYAAALGADTAYSARFHHNPLSAAYVTKVGRDAPYSLAELAQYVDLATPAMKPVSLGIGRNVEVFDRLRRWAYTAIVDWKIGTHDAWHEAVVRRASQIAADVGAASPRGPLKQNEVGHIAKSVARWVWERYVAGVPPLLREAQIAAQRERERDRQRAREAARERSRMTRDEYTAPARQRRSEAQEMRRSGLSLRSISSALRCSLAEIHRLLTACVQGSPGLSDFKGAQDGAPSTSGGAESHKNDPVIDDGSASESSTAHGGAIAAAIVSESAVPARSAEFERDTTRDGRGVRGACATTALEGRDVASEMKVGPSKPVCWEQASNNRKLLASKDVGGERYGKSREQSRHVRMGETSESKPTDDASKTPKTTSKPEWSPCSGISAAETHLPAAWCPVYRRRDSHSGLDAERGNSPCDAKGNPISASHEGGNTDAHGGGGSSGSSVERSVIDRERSGWDGSQNDAANGTPEEQHRSRRPSVGTPMGNGHHEPYESRGSRTVLWAAGGEIPPADPATNAGDSAIAYIQRRISEIVAKLREPERPP